MVAGQPLLLFRGAPNLVHTGFSVFDTPLGGVSVITNISINAQVTPPEGAAVALYILPDERPIFQIGLTDAIGVTTNGFEINTWIVLDGNRGCEIVVIGPVVLNQWCQISGLWFPGVVPQPE